jgi:hypothetical protein
MKAISVKDLQDKQKQGDISGLALMYGDGRPLAGCAGNP